MTDDEAERAIDNANRPQKVRNQYMPVTSKHTRHPQRQDFPEFEAHSQADGRTHRPQEREPDHDGGHLPEHDAEALAKEHTKENAKASAPM